MPSHPLFFVPGVEARIAARAMQARLKILAAATTDTAAEAGGTEDEDVVQERADVAARLGEAESAVGIEGLMVVYPARGGQPPKLAVDGLSLRMRYGEVFGLLGPNGAGKTTTLDVVSGMIRAAGGQVVLDGGKVNSGKCTAGGVRWLASFFRAWCRRSSVWRRRRCRLDVPT